jgi:hypothetical protein
MLWVLGLPAVAFPQLHSELSEECRTVLNNLSPRAPYTCAGAQPSPPFTREQVDALHGDGYFDYIWGLAVEATQTHGGSPGLIMALLMKESHFMPTAVSCNGNGTIAASGIAQIIVENAGGAEAIAQLSNAADPVFEEMIRQRQAEDPSFEPPTDRYYWNLAKFQWVYDIDSHHVDDAGIEAFNQQGRVCETTNEGGSLRDCRSSVSGPRNGLRGFPGCWESIKENCLVNGNVRSNLFCPNYSITLAAVYLRHLSENRQLTARYNQGDPLRAVIARYNNAGHAERECHVHAILGRPGGGYGDTYAALYCSYENEYLNSRSGRSRPSESTGSVR